MSLFRTTTSVLRSFGYRPLLAATQPDRCRSRSYAKDVKFNAPRVTIGNQQTIPNTPVDYIIHFLEEMRKEIKDQPQSQSNEKMISMIDNANQLATGINTYAIDMSQDLSPDGQRLWDKMNAMDFVKMLNEGQTFDYEHYIEASSDKLQATALKMLVSLTGVKSALEIGTFTGFAALHLAEGLPSDGRLVTIDIVPHFTQLAQQFFDGTPQKDKVECVTGDAGQFLKEMAEKGKQFEFIYMDGEDTDYIEYGKTIMDGDVLPINGILAVDNAFSKGASWMLDDFPYEEFRPYGPANADFNKILKNDTRLEQVVLPIRDGLTVARRVR